MFVTNARVNKEKSCNTEVRVNIFKNGKIIDLNIL
mgnify:CR=1 FL=1